MKRTHPISLPAQMLAYIALTILLNAITALAVCLPLLIFLDAILILPAEYRQLTWPVLIVALTFTVLPGIRHMMSANAFTSARWIEMRMPELGNQLSNAAEFQRRQPANEIEAHLCRTALANASRIERTIRLWPLMRRIVYKAVTFLTISMMVVVVVTFGFRSMATTIWPRLFDPYGDHPPYSRLKLTVSPGNTSVLYAGRLDVRVQATGRAVEQLNLVISGLDGGQVLPMFISPDQTYFQTVSNLTSDIEYFVTDRSARSHRFKVHVVHTPKIEAVRAQIRFPEYTRLPTQQLTVDTDPLRVPVHSKIFLQAESNRPLRQGEVILTPILGGAAKTVTCVPLETGNRVQCTFETDRAYLFQLSITDQDGLQSREFKEGRIDMVADQRPGIRVIKPGRKAVATADSIIPVTLESEDDYGVNRIFWFRGINMSVESSSELQLGPQTKTDRILAETQMNLKDLGVRPGDIITYFFEALDNDPQGPNLATSRLYTIEIISHEEYAQILAQRLASKKLLVIYETLALRLNQLKGMADKLEASIQEASADLSDIRKGLSTLMDRMVEYTKGLQTAINKPNDFDIETQFKEHLTEQRTVLQQLVDEYKHRRSLQDFEPAAFILKVGAKLKMLSRQEKTAITSPIQTIKKVTQILAMAKQFIHLTRMQEELVRMARRFAVDTQPQHINRIHRLELQEIGSNEGFIRNSVATFFATLAARLKDLPEDDALIPLKRSINRLLYEASGLSIEEDLSTASDKFASLDGPRGYEKAISALEHMKTLLQACEKMGSIGRRGFMAMSFMGNTAQQILNAYAGSMMGNSGNGYNLLNENVVLYGPNTSPLMADDLSDRIDNIPDGQQPTQHNQLKKPESRESASCKIKTLPDMPFPLRYRELVGDYFRKVAEDASTE